MAILQQLLPDIRNFNRGDDSFPNWYHDHWKKKIQNKFDRPTSLTPLPEQWWILALPLFSTNTHWISVSLTMVSEKKPVMHFLRHKLLTLQKNAPIRQHSWTPPDPQISSSPPLLALYVRNLLNLSRCYAKYIDQIYRFVGDVTDGVEGGGLFLVFTMRRPYFSYTLFKPLSKTSIKCPGTLKQSRFGGRRSRSQARSLFLCVIISYVPTCMI